MIRLAQFVKNNSPEILGRLKVLTDVELEFHRKLSTNVGYHPGRSLRIKLPRSLRKMFVLFEIRELLPTSLRMEVEEVWDHMVSHFEITQLSQLSKIENYLSGSNDRFLRSRFIELITFALEEVKYSLRDPRSPKRRQRPRGYTDGRGSSSENSRVQLSARLRANREARERKQYLYKEATKAELAAASLILARERTGDDPQTISGQPSAAQSRAEELRLLSDAARSLPEEVEIVSTICEDTGENQNRHKPKDLLDCADEIF